MSRRTRIGRVLAFLVAGFLLASIPFLTQPYRPSWRAISAGIRRAAVVHALAAGPEHVVYAAAYEPGGLARSADGGHTWQRVDLGPAGKQKVPLSVAVALDDARQVFVGLVDGALHSADGGHTWAAVRDLAGLSVNAWQPAPGGILYAGTSAGLLASADGGETWAPVPGAPDQAVLALAVDPRDPQILYLGTDRGGIHVRDGTGWYGGGQGHVNGLAGDPATGRVYAVALHRLFFTADTGRTWQEVPWSADLPPPLSLGLASTVRGPVLYVGTVENQGLYRSADEGRTWERLDGLTVAGCAPLCGTTVLCFLTDPTNPAHVLAGTGGAGLFSTSDGGDTWVPVDAPLGEPSVAAILPHPTRPNVVFAGASDGVYRSADAGAMWQRVSGALGHLNVLALAAHPRDPNTLYAGADTGVYRSTDGGNTWHPWMTGIEGVTVYSFTFDPADPATIYAGTRGNNVCRTTNAGTTWAPIHHGLETLSAFAVLVDAQNPRVLTVGTMEDVYRSEDGGESWGRLRGPVAGLTTFCLLEVEGELYAGTTDGLYVTTDGGDTWTAQRAERGGMGARTVVCLVQDPTRPATLYAGTQGGGVYRSSDGGASWQAWSPGLEAASVYGLAFDPFDRARLYAATDRGAFVLTAWMP